MSDFLWHTWLLSVLQSMLACLQVYEQPRRDRHLKRLALLEGNCTPIKIFHACFSCRSCQSGCWAQCASIALTLQLGGTWRLQPSVCGVQEKKQRKRRKGEYPRVSRWRL